MAQVLGFLMLTWETWAVLAIWGVNHQMTELCVCVSTSVCVPAFQIKMRKKRDAILCVLPS